MKEYQGFSISNFRTGFDEAVEPWLLPRDAYQTMVNAHLYRGVLESIQGYTLFAPFSYRKTQSLGTPNGITKTFTITISPAPTLPISSNIFAYGTIFSGTSAEIFTYASSTGNVITLSGSAGGNGTVNIVTGVVVINFNTAPPAPPFSDIFIAWDYLPSTITAIMGIKQYYASNGSQDVLVFDQRRVGKIVPNVGISSALEQSNNIVSELPHDYVESAIFTAAGGSTFTGTLAAKLIVPGTVVITQYSGTTPFAVVSVITDNGVGAIVGPGVTSGSINYVTGAYTITFAAPPTTGNVFNATAGVYGDLFTGTISNFFSLTNYQYMAFFTNNIDPIFYYDGVSVHYLNTSLSFKLLVAVSGVPTNLDITRCLFVFTYRERLLLINVTDKTEPINFQQSTVFWSAVNHPLDFTNDESLDAPTSEAIVAIGYINSDLVMRFTNSERVFRYTADNFAPFRFDSTNNIWACDSSYGTINYDKWFSSVGRPAIVQSDGVNVKRVDEIIPDFTDPTRLALETPVPYMSQTSIIQCYGERFDDLKEGWLCYNSSPTDETVVTASDNVLAFNYLDGTYAVYGFPLSCLGFGRIVTVPTWGTTYVRWEDDADTWGSFEVQKNSLIDLGGDQFDRVYQLNTGNVCTAPGDPTTTPVPVLMSAITKNFNPFIEEGELCRFGYLDLFVSANADSVLRVQFYISDQLYIDGSGNPAGFYQETILTFNPKDSMSPNTNQTKVWKRIYVGSVGKEHTIRFYQNAADFSVTNDQPIYIHAMVPYFKRAGRIFN